MVHGKDQGTLSKILIEHFTVKTNTNIFTLNVSFNATIIKTKCSLHEITLTTVNNKYDLFLLYFDKKKKRE